MIENDHFVWAVPADLEPSELLCRTSDATRDMQRLIDDNNGNPVCEEDIDNILNFYGFSKGKWTIKHDMRMNTYKLSNPVWNILQEGLGRYKV